MGRRGRSRKQQRRNQVQRAQQGQAPAAGTVPGPTIQVGFQTIQQLRGGLLPPPADFASYEATLPGSAERLMRLAETLIGYTTAQQTHRFALETRVVDRNLGDQKTGMWIGGVLAFVTILGGIGLILAGKETGGLVAIITPLAGLVSVFVLGRVMQARQLAEKRAQEMVQAAAEAPSTSVVRRP